MLCVVSAVALTIVHLLGSGSSTPSGAAAPAPSATPTEQRALEVGDCVDGSTRQYTLRACPKGASRIIATPESAAECPEETDVAGTDSNDQIVCLVSLLAPHAGAPGGGGGVYRVGDCLPNVRTEGMMEIPCSLPGAFHKIVALVASAGSCAAPAVRQMTWEEAPAARRVLCLADAQGIASPGECVAWTSDRGPVPIEPTPCTNRPVMKFTGRAGDSGGCGRYGGSSWYYVSPRDALPSVKYNCYRKLG
jgi:hypothetical protein